MPNLFILKFVAKYSKIYARLNDREVAHNFLAIKSTHVSVYFFFFAESQINWHFYDTP